MDNDDNNLNSKEVEAVNLDGKTVVLAIYVLYGLALFGGWTMIIGVIIAYIKRAEVGEIWSTHIENQISTFWTSLIISIISIPFIFIGIGFFGFIFAYFYVMYKTVKGFIKALENKEYM